MIDRGDLGTVFEDGECIVCQGEQGECMYVIQKGKVEVVVETAGGKMRLNVLEAGEVFGEMALFTHEPRSATVRALGQARVLTIDKRGFLKRVHQDPSLAFRILQKLSERVRSLNEEIVRLKGRPGSDL
ncbi:MAG: cyclic nucleotide-binding domain-containing protein [Chloroflexota bacterium]